MKTAIQFVESKPAPGEKITILITDDHVLIREIWAYILNKDQKFTVVAECSNAEEAIEKARMLRPDIVIMDINLPGMNGVEATKQIKKYSPGSKVLGVSMHSQPTYVRTMMKNGASGYVTKNSTREEMFQAILEIHAGNKYICAEIKNILSDQLINEEQVKTGINSLSKREIECIDYIRKGLSSKEIAFELCIAQKTVEVHRYNIFKKLDLKNVTSLVRLVNNSPLAFGIDGR
jgi:two-component system invasion response regulator UvrY